MINLLARDMMVIPKIWSQSVNRNCVSYSCFVQ